MQPSTLFFIRQILVIISNLLSLQNEKNLEISNNSFMSYYVACLVKQWPDLYAVFIVIHKSRLMWPLWFNDQASSCLTWSAGLGTDLDLKFLHPVLGVITSGSKSLTMRAQLPTKLMITSWPISLYRRYCISIPKQIFLYLFNDLLFLMNSLHFYLSCKNEVNSWMIIWWIW